jgi:hypothetical protein
MSRLQRIQRRQVTVEIFTRASEPLALEDHVIDEIRQAVERAVQSNADMRYFPESRHVEERHEYIGVDIIEVK